MKGTHQYSPPPLATSVSSSPQHRRETHPTYQREARAAAAAASQPGRIPCSAIVAILAAVRHSTPVRVVPVN